MAASVVGAGGAGGASVAAVSSVPAVPAAAATAVAPLPASPESRATTQVRRMLNRQYDAVVRDLLGVTTRRHRPPQPPSSTSLYADFDGPMLPDAWRIYKDVGAAIAKAVMADATQKAKFISCDPATRAA